MPLTGKSLDGATAIGQGSVIAFDTPKTTVSMEVSLAGAPTTGAVVTPQTSVDGVHFIAGSAVSIVSTTIPKVVNFTGEAIVAVRADVASIDGTSNVTAAFAAA